MLASQRRWSAWLMMTVPFAVFLAEFHGSMMCAGTCGTEGWWVGAVVVSWFYAVVGLGIGAALTRGSDFAVRLGMFWAASVTVGAFLAIEAAFLGFPSAQILVGSTLGLHSVLVCAGAATFVLLARVYRGEAITRSDARSSGIRQGQGNW